MVFRLFPLFPGGFPYVFLCSWLIWQRAACWQPAGMCGEREGLGQITTRLLSRMHGGGQSKKMRMWGNREGWKRQTLLAMTETPHTPQPKETPHQKPSSSWAQELKPPCRLGQCPPLALDNARAFSSVGGTTRNVHPWQSKEKSWASYLFIFFSSSYLLSPTFLKACFTTFSAH